MTSTYQNEQILKVDLKQQQANRIPRFIQHDSAVLKMELYDDGIKYDIRDADSYIVSIKRSDGETVSGRATLDGEFVVYRLSKQDVDSVGETQARLQVYKGRNRISSLAFRYDVYEDYETVGSAEDVTLLTSLLQSVQDALQEAQNQGGYAESRGDYANASGDYAVSAGDSQKMNWLMWVPTLAERNSKYPKPKNGDTVFVAKKTADDASGAVYRYNGIKSSPGWEEISGYTTSIIQDIYNLINTKADKTALASEVATIVGRLNGLDTKTSNMNTTLRKLINDTDTALRGLISSEASTRASAISGLQTTVNSKLNTSTFNSFRTEINARVDATEGSVSAVVNTELGKKVNKTQVKRDINASSESVKIDGSNLNVGNSEYAKGLKSGEEQISVNTLSDEGIYRDDDGVLTLDYPNIRRKRGGYTLRNGELTIAHPTEFYQPIFSASQPLHENGRVWNPSGVFYSTPLPAIFGKDAYSGWSSRTEFNGYRDSRASHGTAMLQACRIRPSKRYLRFVYGVDTSEAGAIIRFSESGGKLHASKIHQQGGGVTTGSIVLEIDGHLSSSDAVRLFYIYAAPPTSDMTLSNSHRRRCRVRIISVAQADSISSTEDLNTLSAEELQNFVKALPETGVIETPKVPTPPPAPKTVTKTYTSTAAGNYSYKFKNWDPSYAPNTPFQGIWETHGQKEGAWFFGSGMRNELNGKTITKVRVRFGRSSHLNGYSGRRPFYLRLHSSASKPSTNSGPLNFSNTVYTGELDIGETRWFDVTSKFASILSNGTWYGIGVKTTSTSPRVYMVLSNSASIEVTYLE